MKRYSLPHQSETYEVAQALAQLDAKQQRVARSYVYNVLYGGMTLDAWNNAQPPIERVNETTWREPGGRYWGTDNAPNHAFRNAVTALEHALLTWQVREEERVITQKTRRATMILVEQVDAAAQTMVDLMNGADSETVRFNAAKDIMNRFPETADKGSLDVRLNTDELSDDELARIATGGGG